VPFGYTVDFLEYAVEDPKPASVKGKKKERNNNFLFEVIQVFGL